MSLILVLSASAYATAEIPSDEISETCVGFLTSSGISCNYLPEKDNNGNDLCNLAFEKPINNPIEKGTEIPLAHQCKWTNDNICRPQWQWNPNKPYCRIYAPPPEPNPCVDPDANEPGLLNINGVFKQSSTRGYGGSLLLFHYKVTETDKCDNEKLLTEYYCKPDGHVDSVQLHCPIACAAGACISICEDSDGGVNPDVAGTVISQGISSTSSDKCIGFNLLTEYYCALDGLIEEKSFYCEANNNKGLIKICKDGACITNCRDTDGGINVNRKGIATDMGGNAFEDECRNENQIEEAYCHQTDSDTYGYALANMYPCPVNQLCFDGVCILKNPPKTKADVGLAPSNNYQVVQVCGENCVQSKTFSTGPLDAKLLADFSNPVYTNIELLDDSDAKTNSISFDADNVNVKKVYLVKMK
ncbi:MAG: hypothetical protein ABIG30_02105 [Candidatus Aenigmatarchaeota archaeon]